ncbi:DUF6957 family protein [Pseudomonas sp. S36]|uniref:DUF6957 family protein n=1 Tax=Pseudomonas sp. S36 TaxID=2767447 RepID=UPI003FA7E706
MAFFRCELRGYLQGKHCCASRMHSDRGSIPVNDQSNRDIFKPALSCAVTSFQWGKQVDEHLISDILYGPAQSLSGSGLNDEGLARVAGEDYAGQEVCVVRHWLLLDVLLPEGEQSQLEREGLQATVLYANSIVYDSRTHMRGGKDIISGYESESYGWLFRADDTTFILAGPGGRKCVSLPAITALRDHVGRGSY